MDIRRINDQISVAPQLQPSELDAVAAAGYRTLICNRPDGEELNQPGYAEMAAAAEQAGLEFHYIPAISGQFTLDGISAFGKVLRESSAPVLAYCRSGTRSCMLWALANPDGATVEELLSSGADAGYDLRALAPNLGPTR
jgi:uncharacterized protein (TIGR01244 family)